MFVSLAIAVTLHPICHAAEIADTWHTGAEIPSLSGDSDGTVGDHIVVDSRGVTTIVSREEYADGSTAISLVSSPDRGATWSEPWRLEPASEAAFIGTVAVGPDDILHVVWREMPHNCLPSPDGFENSDVCIHYANSDDGGITWDDLSRVSADSRFIPNTPQISVDTSGGVHIAWNDGDVSIEGEIAEAIYAGSSDGGRTWRTPVRLSADDGAHSVFPRFIFNDATGDILSIGWRDARPGTDWDVWGANSSDGGITWTETLVAGGPGDQWDPQSLVDPYGVIHMGVMEYPSGMSAMPTTPDVPYVTIRMTRSEDGGNTWTPLMDLVDERARFPHLLYDEVNDALWLMYKDEREYVSPTDHRPELVARVSLDGGETWSDGEFATDEGDNPMGFQGFAMSPEGNIEVAFKRWFADGTVGAQQFIWRDPAAIADVDEGDDVEADGGSEDDTGGPNDADTGHAGDTAAGDTNADDGGDIENEFGDAPDIDEEGDEEGDVSVGGSDRAGDAGGCTVVTQPSDGAGFLSLLIGMITGAIRGKFYEEKNAIKSR